MVTSHEEYQEWLKQLKVGDKFAVGEHIGDDYYSYTIAKMTNKQFVTADGQRFWKESGKMVGGSDGFYFPRMEQITDQIKEQLARQKVRRMLKDLELKKLNFGQLYKIYTVLEEVTK